MKMLLSAAAFAAAMGTCASASATIVDATFTGVIGPSSPDNQGIFGPYGVNNANELYLVGGTSAGVPTFIKFASVTINGITGPAFSGGLADTILTANGVPSVQNQVFMQAVDPNQLAVNIQVNGESETGVIPVSIDTPQTITFDSTYHAFDAAEWGDPTDPASLTSVQFASVSSLVYSIPGPGDGVGGVPEPSTWAMMLLGFASLGYAGYRKARAPNAA
jgi:hypothetical protein